MSRPLCQKSVNTTCKLLLSDGVHSRLPSQKLQKRGNREFVGHGKDEDSDRSTHE